ncbi:uncharacterized protein LY89DRAFT_629265 [Mollisia scopiformis]|uniref:YDG domain-containing protein n=1 Tax=Mollisia scopiformis TaxID=149040 RepID=A0A132B8Q7_MOLSC|nr:uncharacterized protein LY89DRAFT_629265 [Mollisia scopiformis]KUJ08788.1 hypothetical protein LY89DRAFT_629265 [Mollisia scopiformis]
MYAGLKGKKRKRAPTPDPPAAGPGPSAFPPDSSSTTTVPLPPTNNSPPANPNAHYAPKPRKWQKSSSIVIESRVIDTRTPIPEWYTAISEKGDHDPGNWSEVGSIKQLIRYCIDARARGDFSMERISVSNVRDQIHKMEFFPGVTLLAVKSSRVLEERGLRVIFGGEYDGLFPWDVRADARALYGKWWKGDVDGDLLTGIVVRRNTHSSGAVRTSKMLRKGYEKRGANEVGDNGLINGQWWPDRRCLWRDGAHGSLEAGIHGETDKGAYAIVVSSNYYADQDSGEILEYCGTESQTAIPTRYTKMMQEAFALQQPIRVIRAAKKGSDYAPKMGYRYDGLYIITSEEVLDAERYMTRFTLKRKEGQDPIRYQGVEARPTKYEMHEHMKIKELLQG